MQRKASARWQGTHAGRQRHAVDAERHAARHALLVQGALRRRQGNQSRGAPRRRARRLLHDGAVVHAQQCGLHRDGHRHRGAADDGHGRRQADDHRGPSHDARAGARTSPPRSSRRSRRTPRSTAWSRARSSPAITVTMDAVARVLTRRAIHGRSRAAGQGPRRDVQSGEPLPPRAARSGRRRLGRPPGDDADDDDAPPPLKTIVRIQPARTIIARNDSPDIPFTQSINPYQGCEHGCIYCYARPTHAYLDLSPGLDFETKLFAKPNAAAAAARRAREARLRLRPDRARHQHRPVPADRARVEDHALDHRGARRVRPSADDHRPRARWSSATSISSRRWRRRASSRVFISIAMLDRELARKLEPRARGAAAPPRRSIKALRGRRRAGRRQRRAGDSAAHRPRPRSDPRGRGRRRRAPRRAGRCCGCRSRSRRSSATGSTRTTRCARRT